MPRWPISRPSPNGLSPAATSRNIRWSITGSCRPIRRRRNDLMRGGCRIAQRRTLVEDVIDRDFRLVAAGVGGAVGRAARDQEAFAGMVDAGFSADHQA